MGGTSGCWNANYEKNKCTDFQPFRLFRDGKIGNNEYRTSGIGSYWWLRCIYDKHSFLGVRPYPYGDLYYSNATETPGVIFNVNYIRIFL